MLPALEWNGLRFLFLGSSSFIPGTPGLSESCIHNCDAAETGFYTQWWTVSSILALLAPEYVAHHTDAIHQWIIYLHYLWNDVFMLRAVFDLYWAHLTGTSHCSSHQMSASFGFIFQDSSFVFRIQDSSLGFKIYFCIQTFYI